MSQQYRVVGGCEVAGTPPGGLVTRDELERRGALIQPLIAGGHLIEHQPAKRGKAADQDDQNGDTGQGADA